MILQKVFILYCFKIMLEKSIKYTNHMRTNHMGGAERVPHLTFPVDAFVSSDGHQMSLADGVGSCEV